MFSGRKYGEPYPFFPSRSQGFAALVRCLLPVSNFDLVHVEGESISSVYLVKKIFSTAEKSNGDESSSPSAPFSRSSPLASNFNYTLPIGRTDRGAGQRGRASKRGLERREWLDARPTYQDNGFHIGADAPYIPIRSKGLRLISIASRYPSPGWKASASAHTNATHARIRVERARPTVCSIAIFTLLQRLLCPTFPPARERTSPCFFPPHFVAPTLTFPPIELFLPLLARRRVIS